MTKLCADAIGLVVNHVSHYEDGPEAEDEGMLETAAGFSYDPLRDDAQCMALEDWLIERGYLHYEDGNHLFYSWPLETSVNKFSADFDSKAARRAAIVECVAKMQAAK